MVCARRGHAGTRRRDEGATTKPLLRAAADASWNDAVTLEEFAEPTCFTTAAFADSVHTMLGRH